jgi:GT2 family glycosyltransferase
MRVDFAHAVGSRLLICGWVLGLADTVASATLTVGQTEYDLLAEAVRLKRTDVSKHFSGHAPASDEHGFLALLAPGDLAPSTIALRLMVVLRSGESAHSDWPILRDEAVIGATLRAHEPVLRPLIPRLTARQRRVFAAFGPAARMSLRAEDLNEAFNDADLVLTVHVQLACLLPGGVLVVGGVLPRPLVEARVLALRVGARDLDLLEALVPVDTVAPHPPRSAGAALAYLPGSFLAAVPFADELANQVSRAGANAELSLRFACARGNTSVRLRPTTDALEAQAQCIAHLAAVEPNARLALYERILSIVPPEPEIRAVSGAGDGRRQLAEMLDREMSASVKDLPGHLDYRGPDFAVQLYMDQATRVAEAGVFLTGWCYADADAQMQILACGAPLFFDLGANWVRCPRPDVDQHLRQQGLLPGDDTGFFCYVPRRGGAHPDYLQVNAAGGKSWRLRLPSAPPEAIPQAIRAVLSTIDPTRGDLRRLLDGHVGPAVGALWAAHAPSRRRGFVNLLGPQCAAPEVSIVVPLFGRHDFADYQLALFADDPDFAHVELIYVVDDPSIAQEFRGICPDLYGMHGVPFVLAYPGANLGFAGATNYGATLARADRLLLLNSDVMPRQAGWLGRLLSIHRAHSDMGVLGAKLLYEDGTVQHAGMSSRREPQLQNLWINHHPHKGLSAEGLTGVVDVEAVTAACALIDTRLYRETGGLSEHYIVGDFEDSDLCHRLRRMGRVNRVALDVSLYHLERQSQAAAGDARWRRALTIYNCWLHDRRWGQMIARPQT